MEGFRYTYALRVRWSEVDGQRIVFNANYLTYLDLAYGEYLRRGCVVTSGLPSTVLAKSTLLFRASAQYDDVLEVGVRTVHIGTTSMTVKFCIASKASKASADKVFLEAEHIYVYVNQETNQKEAVPDSWRDTITAFEQEVF